MSLPVLVATILVAGLITFSSRAMFLLRDAPSFSGWIGRFLDAFPVALFVSLAVVQGVAPGGEIEVGPSLAALLAGAITAVFTRRVPVIMVAGWLTAVLVRALS